MSSEDPFQDSLDDDLDCFSEPGRGSRIRSSVYTKTPEMESNCYGDYGATGGKSPLMKTLMDAEAAANSAAVQLMSFKEILEDDFADSRHSASDNRRMSRQRGLLLEKLEVFKRINKSVRQQLQDLQDAEASRMETDKHIDLLLKKLTQAECDNLHLKRNLNDKDKMVDELMGLRKKEMENTENAVHATKSVETTRAHLQGQLHSKEADNNRLTVQLRGLERQLTEQKLEIDGLRGEISSVSEKAEQEKEGLKKATRAQKQRAERFEAAVDKCYTQLREKDVQLAEACSERDTWRRQQEQKTNARILLDAQIGLLKGQIADITAKLQKESDEFTAANEVLLLKVEKLYAENGDIGLENATLKASIVELELQLVHSKAALKEESAVSQERNDQAEQYQSQVAELQLEVEDLKMKLDGFLREAENTREGRDAEVKKVRLELEGRVRELEEYPELLGTAEQSLAECQDNLRRSEKRCADKAEAIRQLQVKVERQGEKTRSSMDMKESIHEANSQLRQKWEALQRQMEELHGENQELVRRLAGQEESLHYSSRQLEQRSADCQALNRQLEAAVADVRQQVSKVKDKAASRESSLQTRILELEAEKSRRENELKHMKQSKQSAEKQFEVRLKDLQLSLDQSKSHKQSIQNYVDFLKNSYATMFDEGLPQAPSSFGSSYFLK
ncbi:outer dense fiber protein 2 isoform X1 [Oncorhynchus mykiss]|uniref:Outer dense fiber protein 2-like n=1 Tax=Oncorhynchus mykiss TaxID=8022 RepID=A0A8C7VWW4_ONCMY|nr:outer dense fiber protein 2 isoform X1 [Oncorhynchus mykiss]XP_036822453.1 outer dense fiber protein 2 isoform X1 [Oncorhynchus mykiss]